MELKIDLWLVAFPTIWFLSFSEFHITESYQLNLLLYLESITWKVQICTHPPCKMENYVQKREQASVFSCIEPLLQKNLWELGHHWARRVDHGSRSRHKHPPEGEITIMITRRLQSQPQGHSGERWDSHSGQKWLSQPSKTVIFNDQFSMIQSYNIVSTQKVLLPTNSLLRSFAAKDKYCP